MKAVQNHLHTDNHCLNIKNRCNGGCNEGQGFSIPAIVPYERKKQTGKDLVGLVKRDESDESKDLFGLVKHNQSDESSSSESSSSSDEFISDDDEEDYYLWETLVKFCERSGENIFECLKKVFLLYKSCENDDVFQQLLKDVELAKENGYSLKDAFHYAVELRKDLIVTSVKNCDDACNFWCVLSNERIPQQPGCKWFTGENCHCDQFYGTSLLHAVELFLQIFHEMRKDGVINDIEVEVDERVNKTMSQAAEESIERHRKEILEKYQEASEYIKDCDINPILNIINGQFKDCYQDE